MQNGGGGKLWQINHFRVLAMMLGSPNLPKFSPATVLRYMVYPHSSCIVMIIHTLVLPSLAKQLIYILDDVKKSSILKNGIGI